MTNENTNDYPLSMIVREMEPEFGERVIARALEFRDQASEGSRSAFNSAIADNISMDGFRDASKAQAALLRDPVTLKLLEGDNRIAAGVLRVWVESHPELRDAVADYLSGHDSPGDGPDYRRRHFRSEWPRVEWLQHRDAVAAADPDLDEGDVGLMLCCVSGNIPDQPHDLTESEEEEEIDSPLLLSWLDKLEDLPPDAPDWWDIEEFIETVEAISATKHSELRFALQAGLKANWFEIMEKFEEELSYLDIALTAAPEWPESTRADYILMEHLLGRLRSELDRYRPIYPRGTSRAEEMERRAAREEMEETILKMAQEWDELVTTPSASEHDSQETDSSGASEADGGLNAASDEQDESPATAATSGSEDTVSVQKYEDLHSEYERVVDQRIRLESEVARLEHEKASLGADKEQLSSYGEELKLANSQLTETEEYWRQQYVLASMSQAREEGLEPVPPLNVREAIEMAETSFPKQLVFALNSKSERGSQFRRPEDVLNALGWLATTYHRLRSRPGQAPNFDKLLKESCPGWSYKSKQTEVTREQFKEWYTTTVDDKTYELNAHIGKGNRYDQQHTIRIAFDWDDERQQVIVGYIGRHQRNRRS